MRLAYIELCGFRGYQKPVRFDLAKGFTIVDGRNGAGKSTIFDAVEFALTGTISKYLDAKSSGESIDDYLWWSGKTPPMEDRFVEVGFDTDAGVVPIRRTPMDKTVADITAVLPHIVDQSHAPATAIMQLCAATIIRDEHIARLSLDLKEGERFTLLRDAIGAIDADKWIKRGADLVRLAGSRLSAAEKEVEQANANFAVATRQIDQARSDVPASSVVEGALSRLQKDVGTLPQDALLKAAGERLTSLVARVTLLQTLILRWRESEQTQKLLSSLEGDLSAATQTHNEATRLYELRLLDIADGGPSHALAQQARDLVTLASLGQSLGLREGHCPLCDTEVSHSHLVEGIATALAVARSLDTQAAERAVRERALEMAKQQLSVTGQALQGTQQRVQAARELLEAVIVEFNQAGFRTMNVADLQDELARIDDARTTLSADIRMVESVGLQQVIVRATAGHASAQGAVARAQTKLGRARLADGKARAFHNAARRAAAETLDLRLNRVLPLLSEFYKRLRPHPVWDEIEYSVRGDVMRFLKLQVGEDINPQFVFSSGQRRATGLAFLLSINLSIAWSRWQSVLLDDPVQHVDDFRTVHLAEVLAQLCASGRQIICAVEDSALADLMCRRLPTTPQAGGKRIALGHDSGGRIDIVHQHAIRPTSGRFLVGGAQAAGG